MIWTTTEIAFSALVNVLIFGGIFWLLFRPAKGEISRVLAVAWMPLTFVFFVAVFKNGLTLEQRIVAVGISAVVAGAYFLLVRRLGYFAVRKVEND